MSKDVSLRTIRELAAEFDVHEKTLRRYIRQGRLRACKLGTRTVISSDAWREFLAGSISSNQQPAEG
jgi:excisionase family DNA binding protein